ncbi:MAG: DUF5615 family PIN-like protein [candidate division NC10 bacterium]|nr:DUF5615 family PIN-like protein [candidate division NC10 bacterium]
MDHHIPRAIAAGLRARGVDVLSAYEDRAQTLPDEHLLDRATALNRVLVTCDPHLLAEATRRQEGKRHFKGIVYGHPVLVSIGDFVRSLELIAKLGTPEEFADRVEYLPL